MKKNIFEILYDLHSNAEMCNEWNCVEKGVNYYEQIIAIDDNFPHVYYNCGLSLHRLGKYEMAIEMQNKSIEKNPKLATSYYMRGLSKQRLARFEEAINDYEQSYLLENQQDCLDRINECKNKEI